MKWLADLLAHFGHAPELPLPPSSRTLHQEAKAVVDDLREGEVRIIIVGKNARALAELRRLESHARR